MLSRMTTTIEQALAHQRGLAQRRAAARAHRRERLAAGLEDAARLLRERYGARDVMVFGSLATGDLSGEVDVDLAVEGLESGEYFAALADLMQGFGCPVDLVRLEEASTSLRERIGAEGRRL